MPLPIDSLLKRISTTLRELPGAVELYLFGSAANPLTKDIYSDLDLQILSADYPRSLAAWPWILSQAGAIEMAYPLENTAFLSAFCITFRDESLYHKVDIGLQNMEGGQGFLQKVDPKVLLWKQPASLEPLTLMPGGIFMPELESHIHFLFGELIGSIRYVQARKRGQHLTCWRFLSAKFNTLLRCYRWQAQDQGIAKVSLNTVDTTALDRTLPETRRLALLKALDLQSPRGMDRAMVALTQQIAAQLYPAYPTDESPAARLVGKYLDFLAHELAESAG